jgi:hypothetical protein
MHNCVFSYIDKCISGHCAIFSVKVNYKKNKKYYYDLGKGK